MTRSRGDTQQCTVGWSGTSPWNVGAAAAGNRTARPKRWRKGLESLRCRGFSIASMRVVRRRNHVGGRPHRATLYSRLMIGRRVGRRRSTAAGHGTHPGYGLRSRRLAANSTVDAAPVGEGRTARRRRSRHRVDDRPEWVGLGAAPAVDVGWSGRRFASRAPRQTPIAAGACRRSGGSRLTEVDSTDPADGKRHGQRSPATPTGAMIGGDRFPSRNVVRRLRCR
jgi:hypothetical protein